MKKLIVTAFVVVAGTFISNSQTVAPQKPANGPTAEIKFDKETNDFGVIPQGVPASYTFIVTNTGKAPLIITNASATCGCTTPEWTKDPIKPGGKGYVKATYNAATPGPFTKAVTVTSNAAGRESVTLTLKGEVKTAVQNEAVPQKNN